MRCHDHIIHWDMEEFHDRDTAFLKKIVTPHLRDTAKWFGEILFCEISLLVDLRHAHFVKKVTLDLMENNHSAATFYSLAPSNEV